jgi:hypothetical protein
MVSTGRRMLVVDKLMLQFFGEGYFDGRFILRSSRRW